jgi:protoporphyrinogen oxidase
VPSGFRLLAPGSVAGILATGLLSPGGRLRVLLERFVPRRRPPPDEADESLERFAIRRLGREAFDRLVQPLAAGIWTADPARLGMAAALPEFLAMERGGGWARTPRRRPALATVSSSRSPGASTCCRAGWPRRSAPAACGSSRAPPWAWSGRRRKPGR